MRARERERERERDFSYLCWWRSKRGRRFLSIGRSCSSWFPAATFVLVAETAKSMALPTPKRMVFHPFIAGRLPEIRINAPSRRRRRDVIPCHARKYICTVAEICSISGIRTILQFPCVLMHIREPSRANPSPSLCTRGPLLKAGFMELVKCLGIAKAGDQRRRVAFLTALNRQTKEHGPS